MFTEMENPAAAASAAGLNGNTREINLRSNKITPPTRAVNGDQMLAALKAAGELKRLARARVDDPSFPWKKWADFVANELLAATPGDHVDEQTEVAVSDRKYERTTTTKTRVKVIRWPKVNAAVVLCYGAHRVFDRPDQAPPHIVAAVKAGVAEALRRGKRIRYTAEDKGKALGVTAAQKIAAEAWSVEAVDVTAEEWDEIMRQRSNDQQRARRRAKGVKPREESAAAAARASGLNPSTARSRAHRAKAKAEKAAQKDATLLKRPNIYKTGETSKALHVSPAPTRLSVEPIKKEKKKNPSACRVGEIFSPAMRTSLEILANAVGLSTLQEIARPRIFALPSVVRVASSMELRP